MSYYPEGALVEVKMTIRLPKAATEDQVDEAMKFHFGANGSCSSSNPLIGCNIEPWGWNFDWQPTGKIGRIETFDHKTNADGSQTYKQRYVEEPQS